MSLLCVFHLSVDWAFCWLNGWLVCVYVSECLLICVFLCLCVYLCLFIVVCLCVCVCLCVYLCLFGVMFVDS